MNNIILPKNYIFSIDYTYQSRSNYYSFFVKSDKKLNLRLKKAFFNDKLIFNIAANDIFNWSKNRYTLKIDNYKFNQYVKRETQNISLSINYVFNRQNKVHRKVNSSSKEIERF